MNKKYLKIYQKFLAGFIDLKKPLKVVFDCSNGAAGKILAGLKHKNLKLKIINQDLNGNFPAHGPNPLERGALTRLKKEVWRGRADLGVIFDADGDRAFFIDNQGKMAPSYLIAHLLFLTNKPPFIVDIANFEALQYAKLLPSHIFPSKVGTYFIKKLMRAKKASVGVEFSGHYYFKDFFYSDSGILAAIKIMNIISDLPYSLSDFKKLLPQKISMGYYNWPLSSAKAQKFLKLVLKQYKEKAIKIRTIDGITFEFENSWLIARPSNTEPLLRIFKGQRL